MIRNEQAVKQLFKTPGFAGGIERVDKGLTFWTVTAWHDMESMKLFRNSVAHRKAMQKLPAWCSEAAYAHWTQQDAEIPGWDTIFNRLITEGKLTKVKKPSSLQPGMNYPKPKWRTAARSFAANKLADWPAGL